MSLHELSREGLWFGASLRPWQILHSRLARMHTCSLLERDVWELMDETVEAASPDLTRYQCKQEEVQLVMLVGDDGELWRHGGLMEARIRDWLTSKIEEEEAHQFEAAPATFSTEFSEANLGSYNSWIGYEFEEYTDQAEEGNHSCYYFGSSRHNTVARYSGDQFSGPFDSTLEDPLDQAAIYGQAVFGAADYGVPQIDGDPDGDVFYDHALEYHDENEEDTQRYIGANNMATFEAPLDYTAETRYSCRLQATTDQDDDQMEDEELCAVCLEKLIDRDEHDDQRRQALTVNSITRLLCRHSFHSHCLGPWLSASSRCPCCRALITLSIARNEEAPPNLGIGASSGNRSDVVQRDVMGLLAEMEAALDRFGLLC